MRVITLLQPKRLCFGDGCLEDCIAYLKSLRVSKLHIVASPSVGVVVARVKGQLEADSCQVSCDFIGGGEPTVRGFQEALKRAREHSPEAVFGIGGGSALDVAKLVAALVQSDQPVEETFGIGLLGPRTCKLVCAPTTSGTGSDVSPNSILLDESDNLKKGVISEHLVPDAAFIDPQLTYSVPAKVTAYTGLDALTHCVEAYTNRFAHPAVDLYARKGIELCGRYLVRAVADGDDAEAREAMSLASLYGGICLGPVNTAAVHALAYPLGGKFHIPHGLANATLLPSVFRFNTSASPERHADVAHALDIDLEGSAAELAELAAQRLEQISRACDIEPDLCALGVRAEDIPEMAAAAYTVQRLLRNNPRTVSVEDICGIYRGLCACA